MKVKQEGCCCCFGGWGPQAAGWVAANGASARDWPLLPNSQIMKERAKEVSSLQAGNDGSSGLCL